MNMDDIFGLPKATKTTMARWQPRRVGAPEGERAMEEGGEVARGDARGGWLGLILPRRPEQARVDEERRGELLSMARLTARGSR